MYWSAISTDRDRSRTSPQNIKMETNDSMSSTDFADACGRSLAIAAFMLVPLGDGATQHPDISSDLFPGDFQKRLVSFCTIQSVGLAPSAFSAAAPAHSRAGAVLFP